MKGLLHGLFAAMTSAALAIGCITPFSASAEPYENYGYDRWGDPVPSQAGYVAERAVSGNDLGIGHFSGLSDIFRADDGTFYLADSGNSRIVAVTPELDEVLNIYETFSLPDGSVTRLKKPAGVFVSGGRLYIADTENSQVLVSDLEGNVLREIGKPESDAYDQKKTFLPQKVLADKAGNVYVVLNNITTGAAMFSPEGDFMGFYGSNRVQPTVEIVGEHLRKLFMSDEKRARRNRSIPSGITGFDIDGDFIFTCTSSSSQTTDTVKKLNAAGKNIFADLNVTFGDHTPMYDTSQNRLLAPAIIDIDIAEDGNINCLDYTTGRVFQYDEDCGLLFITGTIANQLGGFDHVSALESDCGRLYVTDSAKNTVTVFRETEFGRIVHKASALHNDGLYEEALEPWLEVIRRDGNYRRAYVGAAAAYLRKGDYSAAMRYARLGDDQKLYNKAFEGWRTEFIRENSAIIAALTVIAAAAVWFVRRKKKHRKEERS